MIGWQLEIGFYPGILLGVRSYPEPKFTEHVFYLPLIELVLTIHYE